MANEVFEALHLLEKERGIPVDFMLDKIRKAIITACKNSYILKHFLTSVTEARSLYRNTCECASELINNKS